MPPETRDYHFQELVDATIAYEGDRNDINKIRLMKAKQICIVNYDMEEVRSAIRQAYALMRFGSLKTT